MRKTMLAVTVLAAFGGFAAAPKESPFKAMEEARAAFNKEQGGVFKGTRAADYRTLADGDRFDRAPGAADWVIALPLKRDSRVRYVVAEFKDGSFVKGEVRKLGLKPEPVDAKAFAALRNDFAMLAVRAGASGKDRTCAFYPAGKVRDVEKKNLVRYGQNMSVDPNGRYLGGLCGIPGPLGVDTKGVKYAYTLTTSDGDVLEMGSVGRSAEMMKLMREQLEKEHPDRRGRYSDRDLVDYYCDGTFTYRPVK